MTDREKAIFMAGYQCGVKSERRETAALHKHLPEYQVVGVLFAPWGISDLLLRDTLQDILPEFESLISLLEN